MPNPIDALRFVHEAILVEAARIDDAIHGSLDAKAARQLRDDVAWYAKLMYGHTSGEEIGLFPALVERESHYAETYLHDHGEERELLAGVIEQLGRVAEGAPEMDALRRASSALRAHTTAHVEKENMYVIPWVAATFDAPTQGAIVGKIVAALPQEELPVAIPWIVDRVSDATACAYESTMKFVMPPPVFEQACGWSAARTRPERVGVLRDRVDGVAA